MIATGCSDNASRWYLSRQQVRERATCLERASVLREFELQREWKRLEPEIGACDAEDRRAPDLRCDELVHARNV
jgi:hypothetical protein